MLAGDYKCLTYGVIKYSSQLDWRSGQLVLDASVASDAAVVVSLAFLLTTGPSRR
jgi:hypothetical protein